MKTLTLLTALTLGAVTGMLAQAPGEGAPAAQSGAKSGAAPDSVTTNDSVYKPGDTSSSQTSDKAANGKLPKDKGAKNDTKPVSPPNPPVVDPHENPTSPVNTPKAGEVPGNGK